MVQVVSRRPLIAQALVRFQASIRDICDLQVTVGQGVLQCFRFFPVGFKPPELHTHFYLNATLYQMAERAKCFFGHRAPLDREITPVLLISYHKSVSHCCRTERGSENQGMWTEYKVCPESNETDSRKFV